MAAIRRPGDGSTGFAFTQLLKIPRSLTNIHFLTVVFSFLICRTRAQSYPQFSIPINSNSVFQNQFLDPSDGSLYIGGLNYIYKLNSDLHLIQSEQTGPVDDSPECRPPPFNCEEPKTITDNYNKVILVHQNSLITCGSIYQGTCRIRDPGSLNITFDDSIREVVPNTPSGLAVAFIANGATDRVLYVASSYGDWLRDVPTVSTRLISRSPPDDQLFKVTSDHAEITIPPNIINVSPADQPFNISYIYGFTSGQFSYFAASQLRDYSTISRYTSKLVQLCHGDPNFNSYIELPLVCGGMNEDDDYNLIQSAHLASLSLDGDEELKDVLVASFSKSESLTSSTPSSESAICIYSVDDINQAFYDRRLDCTQQGTDNTEISWAGSTACSVNEALFRRISQSSPSDYCHALEIQSPLGGENRAITISARPVYESTNYITAVAAVQHFETPVIFTGGDSGNFKKLRLDGSSAEVYESLDLHETPVIRNGLLLSEDREFIFITSEDQITKVPVEECHEYTTCEECHKALDPYCGWCSLQAECTRRIDSQCVGSQNGTSLRWLSNQEDECLAITTVEPEFAPAGTVTQLTVHVSNLPTDTEGSLKCEFWDGNTFYGSLPATFGHDMTTVTCDSPGDISTTEGSRTVELQLHYQEADQSRNIASAPFDFYNCTQLASCSQCAENKYGCQWCLRSNQCIDGTQTCHNDNSINRMDCPLIHSTDEILIPAGQTRELQINGINFPADPFSFSCQIQFGGLDPLSVPASRLEDGLIECEANLFNYSSPDESVSGSLKVFWGTFPLDMENDITVTIYKCNRKAVTMLDDETKPTCGVCLSINERFNCSWCPQLNDCLSPVDANTCPTNELLNKGMACQNPTIVSIFPTSGHVAGGTKLSIFGFNLGLGPTDIKSIAVAGIECTAMVFVSSQELRCTTASSMAPRSGKVTVQFNSNQALLAQSQQEFSFVTPVILYSFPVRGPMSGGTRLVLRGTNLDAGLKQTVAISSNRCEPGYSCEIIESNADEITCKTSEGNVTTTGHISVYFDLGCEEGGDGFTYLYDPVVDSFEKLSSIASGGLDLTISGDYFDIIQEARLEFRIGRDTFTGECSNSSSSATELICTSPNITAASAEFPLSLPVANVSLYLDGVTDYISLGPTFLGSRSMTFDFVVDPKYYPLPGGEEIIQVPYDKQRLTDIVIKGKNLTLASTADDVTVLIGNRVCMIFDLREESVHCRTDGVEIQPRTYSVKVQHGNLEFTVGQVVYLDKEFPWQIVAAIIAAVVALLVLIVIVIILYCCCLNFSNSEKNFKELENQMIAMETVVAQECKEAFAELQTGVLSITNDVEGTGIPMWDYKSYAMWALFPNQPNHPVLRELPVPQAQRESVRKGLNRFGLLLANKSFLVQFVDVLEKQNTIGIEDFSNIASLLMVCFQGRMDYATEVMKTLLSMAIEEHVRENQEAVLMRRGAHIVEKIVSHWLAFLMYPYLEEVAGDPLFSLFYAIHSQISRGPVDEVTSVARYGLNEGAIIRQKVEHRFMTLYVKGIDNNLDEKEVAVLDCDTISQVKEKILEEIYKTSPYSTRPHKGEVDLEWIDSPSGRRVLLMDYDGAKLEDGWRRLNTLKTYQIPDKASVAILQTQNGNTSLSSSSSSPSRSIIYANMSLTSSMTPIITHEKEPGAQVMHLVKQTNTGTSKKFDTKNQKVIAEIYLTRLLTTKGIIHPFVEDMLTTILSIEEDGSNLPLPIKYLFDFLDEQATKNNIKDPDIVHQWKTNCLQLRFWVNLIKNPNFVFDINKTPAVDNCLSVIGQFLMDSCSISKQTLTKDSPSSRLLYANEIEKSRDMVINYYKGIHNMPPISDQDMNTMLQDFSSQHQSEFYQMTALNELYFCYACKCKDELMTALLHDKASHKYLLIEKMEEVDRLLAS
ncbi:plexin-A4-like isoform X2 [Apostichopus japonicus]